MALALPLAVSTESARPIRIARVITRLNIGGPAVHAILLSEALNDGRKFTSHLIAGTTALHEGDMLDLAAARHVDPVLLPELGREISLLDDLRALISLTRLFRRLRPDVVHTHMAKAGTVGRLAARLAGVPVVVHTYHGHVFHGYFPAWKTRLFLTIERALARLTTRIIVVGDVQRDEIAAFRVAPREKLVPIRLGLDLERFLSAEAHKGELRRELRLSPTVPTIGIVARLVPIKAHEDLFRAAVLVRQTYPDARFLVVGDGERRAQLERLAASLRLAESVIFLGWRQDLPRIYADLDVVALCSLNEGSPVALIEALASARPVVSTAVGGVPEVVLDQRTGLLVPPRDPARLAEGITRLLQDRRRADELGSAGRRHVYPRYAVSRLVDDIATLYVRQLAYLPGRFETPATASANSGAPRSWDEVTVP